VNNGYFDGIDIAKALSADKSLHDHLKGKFGALVKSLEEKKDLSEDDEKALKAAMEDWKKSAGIEISPKEAGAPSKPAEPAKAAAGAETPAPKEKPAARDKAGG
jgi:hypothetical protein